MTFGIHPSAHDSVLTARSTQVNIITRVVFISVLYMLFSSMRDVVMIGGDNCIVSSIKLRALNLWRVDDVKISTTKLNGVLPK